LAHVRKKRRTKIIYMPHFYLSFDGVYDFIGDEEDCIKEDISYAKRVI
jgi:hypothetical protein